MPKPKTKIAYILLFRGVGGATRLPVAPLREALTEAGFENVATYINSGNAVLRSHLSREKVITTVAKLCEEKFGFDEGDLRPDAGRVGSSVIANNPFPGLQRGKTRPRRRTRRRSSKKDAIEGLRKHAVEGEAIELVEERHVYLHTPFGLGTSKLGEKFDKGLGVPNTARNWNTVSKLRELARKAAGE